MVELNILIKRIGQIKRDMQKVIPFAAPEWAIQIIGLLGDCANHIENLQQQITPSPEGRTESEESLRIDCIKYLDRILTATQYIKENSLFEKIDQWQRIYGSHLGLKATREWANILKGSSVFERSIIDILHPQEENE